MSGSAQDLEAGIWLRLSGDWEWSRQLFERALVSDPGNSTASDLLQLPPITEISASSAKSELWSRLPISIPRWENPFIRRDDASRSAGVRPGWELDIPWDSASMPQVAEEVSVDIGEVMEVEAEDTPPPLPPEAEESDREFSAVLQRVSDLVSLGDPEGAIELISRAQQSGADHPALRSLRDKAEQRLQELFESRIGPTSSVPSMLLNADQLVDLRLDHRAGFVLSQIAGTLSFEDLFALSGMSRLDTARILAQLLEQKIISHG